MNTLSRIAREGGPKLVYGLMALAVVAAMAFAWLAFNPLDEAADVVAPGGPAVPLHDAEAARGDDMPRGGDVGAALPTSLRPQSYLEDRGIVYKFYPSPNWSERRIGDQVEAIVMHVAAGSCEGMRSWFAKPESQVSAHFGVCKNGSVDQYVEIQGLAWHAGICNRPNQFAAQWCNVGINPNRRTIGIELELRPGERIEDYPQMVASLNVLLRWLLDQHDLQAVRSEIIAHADVDSVNRSVDPHCCASMEEIIAQVANTSSLTPTPTSTPTPTATPAPSDYPFWDGERHVFEGGREGGWSFDPVPLPYGVWYFKDVAIFDNCDPTWAGRRLAVGIWDDVGDWNYHESVNAWIQNPAC